LSSTTEVTTALRASDAARALNRKWKLPMQ